MIGELSVESTSPLPLELTDTLIRPVDCITSTTESCWGRVCSVIHTMVAHFVCVLFTGFIIYTAQPGSSLFSWHPTLMAVAFSLLVAEGILVFSPQSSLVNSAARKTKVTCHWALMVSAAVAASTGFGAIYFNKENNSKPHFVSWHGLCGLATVCYLLVQCSAGLNLLYPQLANKFIKLASLKQLHATSGVCLLLLATVTLVTGMYSNWFTSVVTGTSWYACAICPLLMLLIVTNQVKNSGIFNTFKK